MKIEYLGKQKYPSTISKDGDTFIRTENDGLIAWFIFTKSGNSLRLDQSSVNELEKEFIALL